jgi:hypothetical protein
MIRIQSDQLCLGEPPRHRLELGGVSLVREDGLTPHDLDGSDGAVLGEEESQTFFRDVLRQIGLVREQTLYWFDLR